MRSDISDRAAVILLCAYFSVLVGLFLLLWGVGAYQP